MEEKENNKQKTEQEQSETLEFEFLNQKFPATPEGIERYNAARRVFEHTFGRQSQELGQLRKEVPYVKKLGTAGSPDKAQLFKQVNELAESGDADKALQIMAGYIQARDIEIESQKVEADFKRSYEESRKDIFEYVDPELAWGYVMSNYKDELYNAEDPAEFVDRILKPKADKLRQRAPKEVDDSFTGIGRGQGSPRPAAIQKESEEVEKQSLSLDSIAKLWSS